LGTFLVKYTSSGVQQWAKNISGRGKYIASIAFDPRDMQVKGNSLFLTGSMWRDTLNIDTVHIAIPNAYGTIVSKFDLNGNVAWAKAFGYPMGGDIGYSLAVDSNSNVYAISAFYGDSAIFGDTVIFNSGMRDMYFVKYKSNGDFSWVRQTHSTLGAEGFSVASDAMDNLYITGKFSGTAQIGNFQVVSMGANDMFLAKYAPNGDCIGVDNFGYAEGISVVVDNNNNPIVSGIFKNTVTIGNTSYTCNDVFDVFIAQHVAITNVKNQLKSNSNQLLIHANPNTGKCNIRVPDEMMHEKNLVLSIYNSQGKVIQQIPVNTNEEKIKINLEAEATGIYNAVLSNGNKTYSGKIVFE